MYVYISLDKILSRSTNLKSGRAPRDTRKIGGYQSKPYFYDLCYCRFHPHPAMSTLGSRINMETPRRDESAATNAVSRNSPRKTANHGETDAE